MRPAAACLLSVLVAACAEPSRPAPASAEAPRAHLRAVKGNVKVKRASGDVWAAAADGQALYENDKLSTSSGAGAQLAFVSGPALTVGEDALIAIAESRPALGRDRTDVTVLKGRIDAAVQDTARQSLSVSTPTATVRSGREIVFQ